ncbi:hypothetical protein CLPU_1c00130 [Gottschalkia purinilytica]|uniref:Uncharacterized protein n=1 Tax=Gottschalkia purinilytica TaxID=1503 RepID=A0A0L0WEE3_GOTPU|nr:hypothetical protein [Gottschalkia purinilytica]KNF09848.1 hypothetical protein CLPU_1c00130 [Gottschalkia purinilytica]
MDKKKLIQQASLIRKDIDGLGLSKLEKHYLIKNLLRYSPKPTIWQRIQNFFYKRFKISRCEIIAVKSNNRKDMYHCTIKSRETGNVIAECTVFKPPVSLEDTLLVLSVEDIFFYF